MNHFIARLFLSVLHFLYSFLGSFPALLCRPRSTPKDLTSPRRRLPTNLAILFVTEPNYVSSTTPSSSVVQDALLDGISDLIIWCRITGIPELTIYDKSGILFKCSRAIKERTLQSCESSDNDSGESDYEFPLTPPPSDSDSRPLSPERIIPQESPILTIEIPPRRKKSSQGYGRVLRKRHTNVDAIRTPAEKPLTLYISSRASGKPTIAAAARSIVLQHQQSPCPPQITVDSLNTLLKADACLTSPDFMIIIDVTAQKTPSLPLELYGFPPWQIRLTEIHTYIPSQKNTKMGRLCVINEENFRGALDEFDSAEMRFGK